MKKIILLSAILSLNIAAYTQNDGDSKGQSKQNNEIRTLMGSNRGSNGGYGSFGSGYTVINGKDAITLTGRAAWIMNHSLAFGFAGTGFANSFSQTPDPEIMVNMAGGYGGILLEPIFLPKLPIHLSFPIIAGAGGIIYASSYTPENSWENFDTWVEDTQTFLIAEPGVELELNVLRFFRMSFGVSYRFTTDINWIYSNQDVLEGWNAGISFKFGKF